MSRFAVLYLVAAAVLGCIALAATGHVAPLLLLIGLVPLLLLGLRDLIQREHAILRNYPIIGHMRFLLESVRPEIRQYFIEGERDPLPFSQDQRALVYRRAKSVNDSQPFGTVLDVEADGYSWIAHSMQPAHVTDTDFRVTIGGPECLQPYPASVLNISGTSFGALSGNAIMALNRGAALGGFAHNTGEGSISPYHKTHGGDLIWQIATGYFGCRTPDGRFDPERFRQQAADPQVRMIEIKLSQGAKPGHGGVLPKSKLTAEIAATRGVPMGEDCISPPRHSAFSSPLELCNFIARLRQLSAGKPVGLKFAVGQRHEVMALAKAMLETGITPDFIVIDGGEGGTGAAPAELSNHVGMPLADGLALVNTMLIGCNLRHHIRLGASGKIVSAYDLCRVFALGADYAMVARGFMFALGCIQARSCHTNRCPTGIATQDPRRQRALDVVDKAQRVASFHRNTMAALGELLGAAGLTHPSQVEPHHLHVRRGHAGMVTADRLRPTLAPGALLADDVPEGWRADWARARADSFTPGRTADAARSPATADVAAGATTPQAFLQASPEPTPSGRLAESGHSPSAST